MMRAFELKVLLDQVMRETGKGERPILFLTEEGEIFDVLSVKYDEENDTIYMHGELSE